MARDRNKDKDQPGDDPGTETNGTETNTGLAASDVDEANAPTDTPTDFEGGATEGAPTLAGQNSDMGTLEETADPDTSIANEHNAPDGNESDGHTIASDHDGDAPGPLPAAKVLGEDGGVGGLDSSAAGAQSNIPAENVTPQGLANEMERRYPGSCVVTDPDGHVVGTFSKDDDISQYEGENSGYRIYRGDPVALGLVDAADDEEAVDAS